MLRHLFKSKKLKRKDANATAVLPIYGRGATTLPADYLVRNQVEPERADKIKAAAQERREQRNARRLANTQRTSEHMGTSPNR